MTTETMNFSLTDVLAIVSSELTKTKAAKGKMSTPEAVSSMETVAASLAGAIPLMKAPLKKVRVKVRKAAKMARLLTDAVKSDRKDNIKRAEVWVERLELVLESTLTEFPNPSNGHAVTNEDQPIGTDTPA